MKKIASLLCCVILISVILMGCGPKGNTNSPEKSTSSSPKKTLVTLVNGSSEIKLTEDDFKSSATKQKITDPNLKKTHDFEGITLKDLMDKANAKDCKTINVIAKDKMTVSIKAEDAVKYPIMVANIQDGGNIPSGEGGSVKLVYPYDEYPEIQDLYKPDKWCWFVVKVEFVK